MEFLNIDDSKHTQEDFVIVPSDELLSEAEVKIKLSHVHIYQHEYLHDSKFKTANWNVIVYPSKEWCDRNHIEYDGSSGYGSAPDDWITQMANLFKCAFCVSPLHDKDINPSGSMKKPHWHVLITFEGPITWTLCYKRLLWLHCAIPVDAISVSGSVKYMAHINNPEKYQYDPNDISGYCGFNVIDSLNSYSEKERRDFLADIIYYCVNNQITSYTDLLLYAMDVHRDDWFPVLQRNSSMVKDVIKENQKEVACV